MLGSLGILYFSLECLVELTWRRRILYNKNYQSVVWFLANVYLTAFFIAWLGRTTVLVDIDKSLDKWLYGRIFQFAH